MSEYFNSEHLGKSKFYFWYGQVLGDWEGNENTEIHDRDDIPGWSKRYKVLIFGQDPKNTKDGLSNTEAPMAEVMMPTSAGSGIGGGTMTPNIGQNSYVIGFYKDGVLAREPIIMGLVPNIPQTRLFDYKKNDGPDRYNPATGYDPTKNWHLVSNLKILADGSGTSENIDPNINHVERHVQFYDGKIVDYIPKTYECDGANGEMMGMENIIQNSLNAINKIKNESSSFLNSATALPTTIESVLDNMSGGVSSLMKGTIQKMRSYTINEYNKAIKIDINLIPPNLRPNLRIASETATDVLTCVFNNIVGGLLSLVKTAINKIIGGVNAGLLTIQNIFGDVLSNVLDKITGAIDSAISLVSGIIGGALNFAGNILSSLDIFSKVLGLFTCQQQLKCPGVDEWSLWYGAKKTTSTKSSNKISENISKIINNIKASNNNNTLNPNINNSNNNNVINNTVNELINMGPQLCGPPKLELIGTGSGFSANPIISGTGSLLGFDIINSGENYNNNTIVSFRDNCGIGNGAVILPVINNGQITNLIVLDEGVSYLSSPNGSLGGGGNVLSNQSDTVLFDGNSYNVIPSNNTVAVNSGDAIYLPPNTTTEVYDSTGNVVEVISGIGGTSPIIINSSGSITTPQISDTPQIQIQNDTYYPIQLELDDVIITNSGINYNPTDQIVVIPSLGSELTPTFDENGRLISVNIDRVGVGFTERPTIYINSETGINARMIPIFKVNNINSNDNNMNNIVLDQTIINIIDCVGRVYDIK